MAGNWTAYSDPKRNLNNEGITTKYTYDTLNRLSEVKDALGQITKYQYNASGLLTNATVQKNETDVPKVISTNAYNEVGGLVTKSDSSGSQSTLIYNK